jgi:hypothetical protein
MVTYNWGRGRKEMARPGTFLPIAEDSKKFHMGRHEGAAPKKNLHSDQTSQQSI